MTKYLYIEADTNDADYTTSRNAIGASYYTPIEVIRKVAKAIEACDSKYGYNWPTQDQVRGATIEDMYPELTAEEIEIFNEVAPFGEYGIHTITAIWIAEDLETIL